MIAITPKGERWYTPESERDSDEPTEFQLRDLTHGARVRIFDALRVFVDESSGSITTSAGSRTALAVKAGLIGVRGLVDGSGAPVKFEAGKEGKVSESFLERIPWGVLREIADELLSEAMSTEEVGKSEPSPEE